MMSIQAVLLTLTLWALAEHDVPPFKPFAPGIEINWKDKIVAVDAEVVLREGMLEVFACSPNTKEHESILRTIGRPIHIFQALGMLGLEPGHPPYWDEHQQTIIPAKGPPLHLSITYEKEGQVLEVKPHRWLWNIKENRPAKPLGWVFSGSRFRDNGTFESDVEGTVVCVVDFDSALISLPHQHSAKNAELWLRPNTEQIPPAHTRCRLLIRVTPPTRHILQVDRFGRLSYDGQQLGKIALEATITSNLQEQPELLIEIHTDPWTIPEDAEEVERMLVSVGMSPNSYSRATRRIDEQSHFSLQEMRWIQVSSWTEIAEELTRCFDRTVEIISEFVGRHGTLHENGNST